MKRSRWNLAGLSALVTGGTRGIGRAIAEELLGLGARVTIVARTEDDVAQTVAALDGDGSHCHGIAADVSVAAGRELLFPAVSEKWGGLDILINNVGTNIRKRVDDYVLEEIETIWKTNLVSALEMCRLFHPLLRASDDAAIVNVAGPRPIAPTRSRSARPASQCR